VLCHADAERCQIGIRCEIGLPTLEGHFAGIGHGDLVPDLGVDLALAANDVVVADAVDGGRARGDVLGLGERSVIGEGLPVALFVIVPKKFARVATLTGSPALSKKVVTITDSESMTSVSVKLPHGMSGNVKMTSSTKTSFTGAFAYAGIVAPIIASAITVITSPFRTLRIGPLLFD
jgi:hypothetical protein